MKILSIGILFLLICASPLLTQQISSRQDKFAAITASVAVKSQRVQNAVIAVQVNDTLGGAFNPYKGLFNIGTPDNKPLLFLFPSERYTSHFNVRIDGTVYSSNITWTGAAGALPLPLIAGPQVLDSSITCLYRLNNITIEQRLTAQRYTATTGAILIQYTITNQDVAPHEVGLLLMLDTNINGKDDARVWTSFGYRQGEHQFTAPFIPDYFQAFERNDLTAPGLIAQGTLIGREAVRPDLLIVGQWSFLSKVTWDYTLQQLPFYDDSAVILRWNETRLAPSELRIIASYYGVGDVTTDAGNQLALNLTAPSRLDAVAGQLSPNPFEINLIVFNTGTTTATAVQATLGLPSGLKPASGEALSKQVTPANLNPQQIGIATWKILAPCPNNDVTLNFDVNVTAANVGANSIDRQIFIPSCAASLPNFKISVSPKIRTVTAGLPANFNVGMQASGGFVGNVNLSLFPQLSGINSSFAPAIINAATSSTLSLQTAGNLAPGNYDFIITGEGSGLMHSDTVALIVLAGPDQMAPFTSNHNPARGSRNVLLDTGISVEVHDANPGVDLSAVTMTINGIAVSPQISGTPQAYTLRYKPSTPFRDNQTVQVRVNARDLATPPNVMPEDSYIFTTVRDSLPPFTLDHFPARGASQVPVETKIEVRVRDALTGVDRNSMVMRLNGIVVSPVITGDSREYSLSYQPPTNFRRGDTVRVQIDASDLASTSNRLPTDSYNFSILADVKDTTPPYVVNHSPAPRATGVSPNTTISFEVRDEGNGVDSASVMMRVNRSFVQPILQHNPNGFVVTFKSNLPFALNDTVRVSVDARDRAAPPNVMTTENFYFVTQRDVSPPLATNHRPAKGAANVPLDSDIRVDIIDELAGVDRGSLTMQVNGQPVSLTLTPILQGFSLQYKPAQNFRYNSTVQVVIRGRDLARPANEMSPDTLRFATIRDVEPPFATDQQPAKGSTDAPANTNIVLHLRDLVSGGDRSSIVMNINGAPVTPTITGAPQDYKLEYDPPQNFLPGDTVRVSLGAQDLSFPPNAMTRENYFFVIQQQLPDLAVTSLRPLGVLFVGLQGAAVGEIANTGSVSASRAFNVQFRVDGGTQKDTTFTQLAAGERATVRMPLRFQTTGTHEVELLIDTGDNIREVTEANNSQKLVVQISQAPAIASRLIVRPNPFTPNNDGFNDQVEFDYAGLGLRNPSLQIFDANGISIWSSNGAAAGRFTWNGRNNHGREVIPGVYLYTLRDQGNNVASGYVVVAR